MQLIENKEFEGERPLFGQKDLNLVNIRVLNGESAIKETENINCTDSSFNGKYPFWHTRRALIENCEFKEGARAAIWYSYDLTMRNSKIIAPKMFRRAEDLTIENVEFTDARETLWDCRRVKFINCTAHNADYIFMNSSDIEVKNFNLFGDYSFQNCNNVVIRNSHLETKDAFWEARNVTVYDSTIEGEYLGWHSENLTLINCHLKGTQPLCYARGLKLVNCTMDADCDLAFEYSDVEASILGAVTSIKNPLSGKISVGSLGELIKDKNVKAPDSCIIEVLNG